MSERRLQRSVFSASGTLATFDEGDFAYMMHTGRYSPVALPTCATPPPANAPSFDTSPVHQNSVIINEEYGLGNDTILTASSLVHSVQSASKTSTSSLPASMIDSTFAPPMLTSVPGISSSLSTSDSILSQSLFTDVANASNLTSTRAGGSPFPPSMLIEHHAAKTLNPESVHLKSASDPWDGSLMNPLRSKSPSILSHNTNKMLKSEARDVVAKPTQPGQMPDRQDGANRETDVAYNLEMDTKDDDARMAASQEAMLAENALQTTPSAFQNLNYLESLPDVVENLSKAQKQQTAEIEHQYQEGKEKNEKLQRAEENLAEVKDSLCDCKRRICLAEEDCRKITQNCKDLLTDVERTILDSLHNTKRIREAREKMKNDTRLFSEYIDKMNQHKQQVDEVESKMVVNKQRLKQQQKVQKLQAEKSAMKVDIGATSSSNNAKSKVQLQQEMTSMKDRKQKLLANIAKQKTLHANEEAKQASLSQETSVLHKRNRAQLTRLKKQLKEAQLRNKQWHDEASHLQAQIKRLKKFTEE